MKIKIYQINMDRDNGNYSFTNYENTIRRTGGGIRSSIYDCVFDGEVACKGLEEVYEKFNIDSPPGFKGHSLSVSDIVEIAESDSVEKGYYFCDSIGFKKIDFEPEKAEKNMDNKITVVLVEPGKLARIAHIGTSLSELQAAVDGNIETFYPYEEQVCIVCDDEGKICGKPLNRAIYNEDGTIMDIMAGTFFICDCSKPSFGSLSEEQQQRFLKQFKYPEQFCRINGEITAIRYKPERNEAR